MSVSVSDLAEICLVTQTNCISCTHIRVKICRGLNFMLCSQWTNNGLITGVSIFVSCREKCTWSFVWVKSSRTVASSAINWPHGEATHTHKHVNTQKMLIFNVHFLPALPYHLSLYHYGANRRWQRHFFLYMAFCCLKMWLYSHVTGKLKRWIMIIVLMDELLRLRLCALVGFSAFVACSSTGWWRASVALFPVHIVGKELRVESSRSSSQISLERHVYGRDGESLVH